MRQYYQTKEKSDSEFGKQLRGKSQYNLEYYSTPTEMFARCFELYVYYVWGEDSSLLEKNYNQEAYECTKETLERIKDYFEKIFV